MSHPVEGPLASRRGWMSVGAICVLVWLGIVCGGLAIRAGHDTPDESAAPGYCGQLLDFCLAARFEQPGAGYLVKAYCGVTAAVWKECAVAVWNGRSFSYGQGGSVKTACYVEEARLDPKTHVAHVRKLRVALVHACDVVQVNA